MSDLSLKFSSSQNRLYHQGVFLTLHPSVHPSKFSLYICKANERSSRQSSVQTAFCVFYDVYRLELVLKYGTEMI